MVDKPLLSEYHLLSLDVSVVCGAVGSLFYNPTLPPFFPSFQVIEKKKMYRNLSSTTIRILAQNTTPFRHVYTRTPAVPFARLSLVSPNVTTQRSLHLHRQLLRSEVKPTEVLKAKEQTTGTVAAKPKKTLWQKVKEEANHYWDGTKLLGLEVKISSQLTLKLLNGGNLTRREDRQVSFNISNNSERQLIILLVASYNLRSYATGSICLFHRCAIYGTIVACCPQIIP